MNFIDIHTHILPGVDDGSKNIEDTLVMLRIAHNSGTRQMVATPHMFLDLFENYDFLLCPTVVSPPFDANIRYLKELDGVRFETYIDWLVLTFAITLTSCPAISVPCGFTKSGLPVGLQIIAPPFAEASLLGVAALIEEMSGLSGEVPVDPLPAIEALASN